MSDVFGALAPVPGYDREPGKSGLLADFLKSIPRGLLQGLSKAASASGEAAGAEMAQPMDIPSPEATSGAIEQHMTGPLHQPEGRAGRFGEAIGEMGGNPANWFGPQSLAAKAAWNIASGLGSEGMGQLYEGTPAEPYARAFGSWSPMIAERAIPLAAKAIPAGAAGAFGGKLIQPQISGPNTAIRTETSSTPVGIRAYHGSPYDFDRFDLSKIGTGEGSQSYGHGLYFAEHEPVARQYRDALTARNAPAADRSPGHMYEVNINAKPEQFLDWDRPLAAQYNESDELRKGLRAAGFKSGNLPMLADELMGGDVVDRLSKAGIPGIKYLDQGSRIAGQRTNNYVVFNDKLIKIMRKYAMPGMLGGTGIGSSFGSLAPQQE